MLAGIMESSRVAWADLHNHNEIGYGVGSLARSYALAENLLDVYAFVPHGHWPDPPATDPKLLAEHEAGFERVSQRFPEVVRAANTHYRPGQFVSFIGFEWHSTEWGDYQVIFPGDTGELFKAATLPELQEFARATGALLIPHHVGYRRGWRGANWATRDPILSPVVEVFSEHGSSVEAATHCGMLGHSMGGVTRSQTALAQLLAGQRFGLIGSTDTHHGHPGSYNEGLAAILTEDWTREGIFAALRARHVYAVTGDRIGLDLRCGAALMGDVLPVGARRELTVTVEPVGPVEFVKLVRNGQTVQTWTPGEGAGDDWWVRVDFGWDRLGSRELTLWDFTLEVTDAEIVAVLPAFSGGALGKDRLNRVTRLSPRQVRVESFTSRDNPLPVNGVAARLRTAGDCRLRIRGTCELTATLRELLRDDAWAAIAPRFSAPKLRLGQPFRHLRFETTWRDPAPTGDDFYLLKVQQANGQMAWSTPIWFSDK
jgi:hypothetical protein